MRPVILTFNRYYLPAYRAGGPIRTVANLVGRLGDQFDFRIVALDSDIGELDRVPTDLRGGWNEVGDAKVRYVNRLHLSIRKLANLVRDVAPDVIYLNSFFDPIFTQRILWARRLKWLGSQSIVLAPRGEFSPGALSLKSRKKRAYIASSKPLGIYRNLIWQASSPFELAEIQQTLPWVGHGQIRIAKNLVTLGAREGPDRTFDKDRHSLRVCFLSRISRKKNLDYALRVLHAVDAHVTFTIFGPKEDEGYWRECERLIEGLPSNVTVAYRGEISPTRVHDALSEHDLFFLPTLGENYGHVVHEAFSAGLSVLISDQTPWRGLEQQGVGWALPLTNVEAFVSAIEEAAEWSPEQLTARAAIARSYAKQMADDAEVLEDNARLFFEAAGSGYKL
jgi:glycosyltransferase involved in cell wall biosynthesis